MTRPLLLDLYCCAGGIATGFHRAGFDVIGVDVVRRPNYPFEFRKMDALVILRSLLDGDWFADTPLPVAINAAPPCQKDNPLTKGTNRKNRAHLHRSWTADTRTLLDAVGLPYIIEQPAGSGEIREDLKLCMDMFYPADYPPPWVQRHRSFELSGFTVPQPKHPWGPVGGQHRGYVRGHRHGPGHYGPEAPYVAAYGKGGGKAEVAEMQHAMMIDHTDVHEELTEAVPPAYGEYIGRHLHNKILEDRMYQAMHTA